MNNTIGPAVNERELTPREEGVRRFLLESDHVCPFGRDSAEGGTVRMLEVSGLTPQEQTYQALGEFLSNGDQDALVLISAIDPENHNTGRIEASTLNIELAVAMDRIARPGQNLDEITAKWSDARAQLVMGGENNMPLSPLIGRGGHEEKLYAIAMGPQFGKSHPRFSPHLCVVAIRAVALEKAAEAKPRIAEAIREQVRSRLKKLGMLSGDPDAPRLIVSDEFYNVGAHGVSIEAYDQYVQSRMAAIAEAQRMGLKPVH
jgi:hypothetical protein